MQMGAPRARISRIRPGRGRSASGGDTQRAAARHVEPHGAQRSQPLGGDGGRRRSGDAPAEDQDEQGIQNYVGHGAPGQHHRGRAGTAFGHQQVVGGHRQH